MASTTGKRAEAHRRQPSYLSFFSNDDHMCGPEALQAVKRPTSLDKNEESHRHSGGGQRPGLDGARKEGVGCGGIWSDQKHSNQFHQDRCPPEGAVVEHVQQVQESAAATAAEAMQAGILEDLIYPEIPTEDISLFMATLVGGMRADGLQLANSAREAVASTFQVCEVMAGPRF